MKSFTLVLFFLIFSSSSFARSIKTVDSVDPQKFVGTWYRISSRPIILEPSCACARQVLKANSNNTVGVLNTCNKDSVGGKPVSIEGYATPLDNSFSKFDVRFKGAPLTGSYWVVALDDDYNWAVVSDKYGFSLYVMSRKPQLSKDDYMKAITEAASNGAPVDKLEIQVQNGCQPYPPEQT